MRHKIAMCSLIVAGIMAACAQNPAPTPAPTPPSPEQTAKAKYELDEKCGGDARTWFKANYSEPQEPIKVRGGGEIVSLPSSYRNHFSHRFNGCFAMLETLTTFPAPTAQTLQSDVLWDVNENRKVGGLVQKDFQTVTACNVEESQCTTKSEFEAMVRDYMAE